MDRVHLSYEQKWGWQWKGEYFDPAYDTFPSPTTVVADALPASRLVGIELNPGPSSTQPGPLTSSSSSTSTARHNSDSSITHHMATTNNLDSHPCVTWSERTDWITERNEWNRKDPISVYLAVLIDTAELVKDLADIVLTYLEPPHYYQPYDHGRPYEPGTYLIPLPRSARPVAVAFQLKLDDFCPTFFIRPDVYIITQFYGKLIEEVQEKDHLDGCTQVTSTTSDQGSTMSPSGWSYRATDQVGVIELISNSIPPSNQVGYGLVLDHLKVDYQTIQLCHMFPSNWSHLSSFRLRRPVGANWLISPFITFTFFYTTTPANKPRTRMLNSLSSTTQTPPPQLIHLNTPCLPLPCKSVSFSACQEKGGELILSYPFTTMTQTCQMDASTIPSTIVGDRSYEELRWSYHQAARKGVEAVQQLADELKSAGQAMLRERAKLATDPWLRHSDLYLDGGELPSVDQTTKEDAAFEQLMRDYHQTWLSDPANQSRVPFKFSLPIPPSIPNHPFTLSIQTVPAHQPPQTREVEPLERKLELELERKLELELETVRRELTQAQQTIEQLNATISGKEKELIALKDHFEQTTIPNLVYTHQQQIKEYVTQVSDLTNRLRSFELERRLRDFESTFSRQMNSTPIVRLLPQTMFKDGLRLISSYLDQHEFVTSLQVCHHWADSFSSSTSRGMTYPIEMDGTVRFLPPMRLRQHFTRLSVRGDSRPVLTMDQLFSIGRQFPSLTQFLPFKFRIHSTPASTARVTESTAPICIWPFGLKELMIDLDESESPHLIRAISTCISLVRLSLERVSSDEDFSLFQSYEQLIHLEYFELAGSRDSPREIDLLSAMRWLTGPPNLRVLKLESIHFSLATFSQLRFPMLEDVICDGFELKEGGDLARLLSGAPNLRIINVAYSIPDLGLLKQFHSLHTLRLYFSMNGPDESEKIQAVCNCTQLTSLQITLGTPQLPSSWVQLSRSLLHLVELHFDWCFPTVLDVLLPFQSLTKLVFEETGTASSKYVRDYFRSPMVMPQLCHIEMVDNYSDEIDWIWRKEGANNTVRDDAFREPPPLTPLINQTTQLQATSTPTIAREPSLEDLTKGIEPNPGN